MEHNYPTQQKNWFERNWKWFVPTGCLALIAVVVVFATVIILGISSVMHNSDVYQHSMETAKKNKQVVELIGNTIEEDEMVSGSINTSGHSGNALLDISVKGSKGKGLIHVQAEKQNDIWTYSKLNFYPEGSSQPINLLE